MSKAKKWLGLAIAIALVLSVVGYYLSRVNIPVLEPKGTIADQEFRLLVLITAIMLIVVVPTFILLAYISVRYREDNPKRVSYQPNWDHSRVIEGLWWLIPSIIITAVAIITWNATYALNPYKPIVSNNKTITIDVIAMNWKWLFIYPNQRVAAINQVVFPVNTPIHFFITADAPMNSFWLPQLSGQIYAMAGMQTQLYLMANTIGSYAGHSANISGIGFASMNFTAKSTSKDAFNRWVNDVKARSPKLTDSAYVLLSRPSSNVPVSYYSRPAAGLFGKIINQYMSLEGQAHAGYEGA